MIFLIPWLLIGIRLRKKMVNVNGCYKNGIMMRFYNALIFFEVFNNSAYAELSCKIGKGSCITVLGNLTSNNNSENGVSLYIKDEKVSRISNTDVNQAFVYYDLIYHKNKNKFIDKLIISYDASNCIYGGQGSNCQKYKMLDLTNGVKLSSSFYPPVINANLMTVNWGEDVTTMKFEDKSISSYKNNKVTLNNGRVKYSNASFDKGIYITN
ncbi:hypothetical protein HX773_23240 [Pantoea sp. B9002]|uniref:hypothetical protein n=1 Tax=Pantoea sp. B9002 TaxID=2726979 RepID=UPI0015A2DB0D|nr:hypothetical protein [Pantoea sp. B9002]NWA63824.1 hypothetical protein [Pantoea sp. B9002]